MAVSCPSQSSINWFSGDCGIDFTVAFEDYILILIPAASLLLFAPLRLRTIWSRTIKVVTPTILQLAKTLSALLFVGFSFAVLIANCVRSKTARSAEIPATLVAFLASVVSFALSHWEHVRSIRPSKLLQLYLIVALIVQAVHLRTIWTIHDDIILRILGVGQVATCAAFLAAESAGKERILITKQRRSPQDVNDLFSERMFWWLNNLFTRGYRNILAPGDLDQTDEDLSSPENDRRFRLTWLKYYHRDPKVSLIRIVFSAMKYDILFPIIPRLLLLAISFAQPYLIMRFVSYLETSAEGGTEEGILLILATATVYTALAIFQGWYWQSVGRFLVKLRGCLTVALHDKALRSRMDSNSSPLTLMNVDVERALTGLKWTHEYWSTAITVAVTLPLLYLQVGIVFLAPLVLLVVLVSISTLNGARVGPKQHLWFSATQDRISYITDVIASMKNIKLLGITKSVLDRGTTLREREVDAQSSMRGSLLLNTAISLSNYQLATLVLYTAYAIKTHLGGEPLTNTRLFTSLSILKLFTSPMVTAIQSVPSMLQSISSLQRIQDYLALDDHIDKRRINSEGRPDGYHVERGIEEFPSVYAAQLREITCGYSRNVAVLANVSCSFPNGGLHVVSGPVGSGKSTLLKTVLGETTIFKGSVSVMTADAALCDQTPWLWNASVKENICGDTPYEKAWFRRVTWACGLHEDFKQLPQGINTPVGSDGVVLSGGQKNRISLARALYSHKRLVVLDDILSGLDTRTEKLVFDRVLGPDGICRQFNCTVIFATHAVGWVCHADTLTCVDAGKVIFQGSPDNAPASCLPVATFVQPSILLPEVTTHVSDHVSDQAISFDEISGTDRDLPIVAPNPVRSSDFRVYKQYLSSFGPFMTVIYFAFDIAFAGGGTIQNLWLKWWAAAAPTSSEGLGKYAGTFTGISVLNLLVLSSFLWFAFIILLPKSSKYLHAKQWSALMHVAYTSWGAKDTGSIVNRFSQDISIVDSQLSMNFINFTTTALETVASTGILVVATPFIAAAIPVVLLVFWAIQKVYLRTSKQLRLMDLEAKAPLCTHFLETVSGVVTIDAFGWSEAYRKKNVELLRMSQIPFYLLESVQNWLSFVLNLVVAGLATVVIAIAVGLRSNVDAGYIGLALIQIMDLGMYCEVLVTSWTGLEVNLGAISRMNEFVDDMPPEQQGRISPPSDWLSRGKVQIQNLTASYAENAEPTLKNIDLAINPGEKIAICGRTGSGKSSLASAIFGLLHIKDGTIAIDDVNITEVSQDLLRSRLVAIPQDPYFAPGTVRDNLQLIKDSSCGVTDVAMISSLKKVGLLHKFETLAASSAGIWLDALDVKLTPADMLTKGQTQLFAMARAMLSVGQIVLIDEATSGLDHASEVVVQKLLRQEFSGRTIVAIAHHLKTIIDFDTVIVMDNGRIAEIGPPDELRDRKGSLFGELLRAAE